jgi:hypothetical protein
LTNCGTVSCLHVANGLNDMAAYIEVARAASGNDFVARSKRAVR